MRLAIVASFILASCTQIIPPEQYDHPYDGKLKVTYGDVQKVHELCHSGSAAGCAYVHKHDCLIILPTTWPRLTDAYYRHERAHCNGWKHEVHNG